MKRMLTKTLDLLLFLFRTECVRLKNSVKYSEIKNNDIENCGIYYYEFDSGAYKNGEGIYMGTSSSQVNNETPRAGFRVLATRWRLS